MKPGLLMTPLNRPPHDYTQLLQGDPGPRRFTWINPLPTSSKKPLEADDTLVSVH